jgi:PPOX class probable F420-dependent enzyme
VALLAFARRSARHPAPVVDPALLRNRTASVANASVFLFSMAFFSLLLATVLFLTEVWGYSALEAGAAFAPGPLMVALLSWPAGSLAGRLGPRRLVLPGVALFAAGCAWWIARAGATPAYLTDLLPGILLGGVGVALTFPVLAGAAVADLPPARAATGSALFTMARQIGGVVGIAVLVAILGTAAPDLGAFRSAWAFMAAAAGAAGVAAALLPHPARRARAAAVRPAPEGVAFERGGTLAPGGGQRRRRMRTMTTEEVHGFLSAGTRTGKLAVVRRDGSPLVTPIWFVLDADGSIVLTTGADTAKGRALRRDPRCALCVDTEAPPYDFVRVDAVAELSEDPPELLEWATRIAARYMGTERAEAYGRRNAVPGELLVRIAPSKVVAYADISA